MPGRLYRWASIPLIALSLGGCARAAGPQNTRADQAAKVTRVTGQANLHLVTLSAEAVTRLDIQTTRVQGGRTKVIPFTAVIYDPDGQSWAYVVVGDRTYERASVSIDHIDGDQAVLKAGPPDGTPVVTAGAAELLGIEYGVGAE